jgi:hypothetical protein
VDDDKDNDDEGVGGIDDFALPPPTINTLASSTTTTATATATGNATATTTATTNANATAHDGHYHHHCPCHNHKSQGQPASCSRGGRLVAADLLIFIC